MSELRLRPVDAGDAERLFAWRNEPFIVERSLSRRTVTREEHARWFPSLLGRADTLAWIVEADGVPIGHARADWQSDTRGGRQGDPQGDPQEGVWLLTIYLVEAATGRGLGMRAIEAACKACDRQRPGAQVIAEVVPSNEPALKTFERGGFVRDAALSRADAVVLIWQAADEVARTREHYQSLFAQHGDSWRTLDWGSAAGQQMRFEVLARIGDLQGRRILDVGCGLAHFADWLEAKGIACDYTGVDLVPELVEAARRRRPQLRIEQGSILDARLLAGEGFDYVFASGIFYTYRDGADDMLRASVRRMWSLCRRGVAFNALGTHAPDPSPGEYYADPQAVLRFCRELTPRAELVIGYHPRDFTMHLLRDTANPSS